MNVNSRAFFFIIFSVQGLVCLGNQDKLHLITMLYNETNPRRIQEYKTCLENNLRHSSIASIHVLYDTLKDDGRNEMLAYLKTRNVSISYIRGRPSFISCFELANAMFPASKVMLTNADIYFNDTLKILESYSLQDKFLAITRKEVGADGRLSYMRGNAYRGREEGSADTWIFQTPIPLFERQDILLGTVFCEIELNYQVDKLGLAVINPYFTIDCLHVHLTPQRHWTMRPYPTKDFLYPKLEDLPM